MLEKEMTLDLRVISLPEGIVHAESEEGRSQLRNIKCMGVNLATLPFQTLHALHQGVLDELQIREKFTLAVISEVKLNNE